MAEELDQLREQIARTMHDAATGRITPDAGDSTPYGPMAAAVVDAVILPLMEQVDRVAYLEARVGELHQRVGDARALAEKRLVAREDWKSRCLSAEASRQAWAEEAGRLGKFRQMVHLLLGYNPDITSDSEALRGLEKLALAWQRGHTAPWAEVEWLRREVEFEANAEVPRSNGLSLPLCSCVTAEQAAQIASAGPLWTPPQCAVHPDGGESDG